MDFEEEFIENPYEILNVPYGCQDLKLIKKQYKEQCLLLHPDKCRQLNNKYKYCLSIKSYPYIWRNSRC